MQHQMMQMQMQPMMAAYYPNNVTTDHIQQLLSQLVGLIPVPLVLWFLCSYYSAYSLSLSATTYVIFVSF
ncbi:hypothetical protein Lalb_Chr06g0171801 [Lupinus albus]|uniref:Uncharacterized protein n=1 Tax=Lupinus albus TaxID=3870 RepID=A0A6A4QDG8_LUPAL|nr:hypothetical protein Lalb_Chr06g0171801 [Lupinus albus]